MASFVQTIGSNFGAGTRTITVTAAVPVGDMVAVAGANDAVVPTGVSDSRGNTYSVGKNAAVSNVGTSLHYSVLTVALQVNDTITVTYASGNSEVEAAWFTTIPATPLDQTQTNAAIATAMSSGATATTTQASEVAIGVFGQATPSAATATGGYTIIDSISGGGIVQLSWCYLDLTATGAQTATMTAASTPYDGVIATFKTAVVAAGASVQSPTPKLVYLRKNK